MNKARFGPDKKIAVPATFAMALLATWGGPTRCAAQSPVVRRGVPQSSVSPPSSVSPVIERFLTQSGRNPAAPTPSVNPTAGGLAASPGSALLPAIKPLELPDERAQPPGPAALPASTAPAPTPGASRAPGANSRSTDVKLKLAPLEPTDLRFPINLATALRLSDARPLVVAAAQASVWVAEAQLTRAKVLWIPTAIFGLDYIRHDGGGPDFNKGVMTTSSVNFFYGGPGLYQYVNITDAYYEPLAVRQVLNARQWEIQTAKNDALLMTADAYFQVHRYRGMYAGALYTVERGRDLVDRIAQLSKELVPTVEVARARNMLADLEQRAVSDREQWRVHSANLTQVLRLDPRAVVVPQEHDHAQITLIDPGRPLENLMAIALANRPEVASRQALVQAAEVRVQREKMRPFLPIVQINGFQSAQMYIQAGLFGIGPNSSLNQFRGRDDVSLQCTWQLENFGFGNLARIKNQRGNESRAIIEHRRAQDMVAADVTRAQARVQSAAARILQAERALRTGLITFNGHLEGLQQTRRLGDVLILTYRPQEAVYSLQLLNVAFDEYFTTVADYNRAQFELFHALGYPAREIASLSPVGVAQPVELARPPYLPPVGHGPPPATR